MLNIPGSYGEGGGQMLRTSLSLSAWLGIPFKISGIRIKRPKPGLKPQHLTALLAAAEITHAEVQGAAIGSTEVAFIPGNPRPGKYIFDVSPGGSPGGSAGSAMLIMQTLLPALAMCAGRSLIRISGGTHVAWSPPFHFIERSFLYSLSKMGLRTTLDIKRWGFYPKGGGEIEAEIFPSKLTPVGLMDRGKLLNLKIISAVANLPDHIARRQADAALSVIRAHGLDAEIELLRADSIGQGTFIYIDAEFENIKTGFSALGERGKRAETVGREAVKSLIDYVDSKGCVEKHLADQLLLYMALTGGRCTLNVQEITSHLITNAWVIRQFLPGVVINFSGQEKESGTVEVIPVDT
ncbi:MAG: RNA 3'-terminal phosphate cyclase [Nitrospirota bacterium]